MDNMGVFIDNHDQPRIFSKYSLLMEDSTAMVLNSLSYIFMSYGIPFVYYGTEGKLFGGSDPQNREAFNPLK